MIGGWLNNWFPWQSVFIFMAGFSLIQLIATYFYLPESLPPEKRISMKPAELSRSYCTVLKSRSFWLLTLALSSNFAGFFLYVAAAPLFVIQFLELEQDQFGWLFIPAMSGVILGAYLSSRLADRLSQPKTVRYGYMAMAGAMLLNLSYNAFFPPLLPWVVLPIMLFTTGMSLATPSITLLTLDLFPKMRGMVASLQGFIQTIVMTIVSSIAAPMLGSSGMRMALGMLLFLVAGFVAWAAYRRLSPPPAGQLST